MRAMNKIIVMVLVGLFIGSGSIKGINGKGEKENSCFSDTIIISPPTDDSFFNMFHPTFNYGTFDNLTVRGDNGGYQRDTLIRFDLSEIDAGATIVSATLKLYYYEYYAWDPVGQTCSVSRVTSAWSESTLTYNNRPTHSTSSTDSTTYPSDYDWMSWDVTTDVQNFVDGIYSNYGWELDQGSIDYRYYMGWRSSDYGGYTPNLEVVIEEVEQNEDPVADAGGPYQGEINEELSFDGGGSYDPDGTIERYRWKWFNGGSWSDWTTSSTMTHVYDSVGTFLVTMEVEDDDGARDNEVTTVTITDQNRPPEIVIDSPVEDESVSGFFNISGYALDADGNETLVRVEVSIDDGPWVNATGTASWYYHWNTVNVSSGPHLISARGFDGEIYSNVCMVNVTVHHEIADVVITGVSGGFGIRAHVENSGAATAHDIPWSIDVELTGLGILLSEGYTEGVIDEIAPNKNETIQTSGLTGIGPITITVQADEAEKQATGFLLGPLVLRLSER